MAQARAASKPCMPAFLILETVRAAAESPLATFATTLGKLEGCQQL
jgi:hypothetical protein